MLENVLTIGGAASFLMLGLEKVKGVLSLYLLYVFYFCI